MNKYKHLTLIRSGQTIKQENEILVKRINLLESRIKILRNQSETNGVRIRQK